MHGLLLPRKNIAVIQSIAYCKRKIENQLPYYRKDETRLRSLHSFTITFTLLLKP